MSDGRRDTAAANFLNQTFLREREGKERGSDSLLNMCCSVPLLAYVGAGEVVFSLCWRERERGNRCKCMAYVTHVARRRDARAQERTLQPIVKALFVN